MIKMKVKNLKQGITDFNDLFENSFVKTVISRSDSLTSKILKNDPGLEKKNHRDSLTEKEKFDADVFDSVCEITHKLEMLNYVLVFINSYPKKKVWEKTFSRATYISYHYESYLNNIIGVLDRCLLLINFIYDLGIEEKYVDIRSITSNKHIKGETVKKFIDLFDKLISGIRYSRNIVMHRRRFSDAELDKLGRYEFCMQNQENLKLSKKQKDAFNILLKLGFSSFIRKSKKDIKKNNLIIIKLCNGLFSAIESKYKFRLNSFEVK